MKEFLRALVKGGEWSVLFLGLVGCLAGALITFVSGDTTYAVLLLLLGLVMGAALWKREVTWAKVSRAIEKAKAAGLTVR